MSHPSAFRRPYVPTGTASDPLALFRAAVARALAGWLVLGVLATLFVPAARGASEWLGAIPFWTVAVPAAMLAVLHRLHVAAALGALLKGSLLVRSRRRRRRPVAQAVRRVPRGFGQRRLHAA